MSIFWSPMDSMKGGARYLGVVDVFMGMMIQKIDNETKKQKKKCSRN